MAALCEADQSIVVGFELGKTVIAVARDSVYFP
jgi:hypothetical protein